ncbi:MAG TPA: lysophospholipase [Aestuariivirgaceae bacterium]|nr:lysophospholipase [Aestuariivirgaceae bacterium]
MSRDHVARLLALLAVVIALVGCAQPRVQELSEAGSQVRLETDALVMEDGVRLPLSVWAAERPRAVIVAVHGFNGYANDFHLPGPWFAARDVSVYAYDQRGFGRHEAQRGLWPGGDRLARDLVTAVDLVERRHGNLPVFVLGFSMGGAVALQAATQGLEARGLVLAAPAVWGWQDMNPLYRVALWGAAHAIPATTATGSGLGVQVSDNIEWLRAYGRDPLNIRETRFDALFGLVDLMQEAQDAAPAVRLPAFFVYGANDDIIPEAPTTRVMAGYGGTKRVAIYGRGWHMVLQDRQRERVWRDILTWMNDPSAVLPSGEEVQP